MEFWGVEVKCGKPLSVQPGEGMVIHLSQACLGEIKEKGKDSVCLSVNINGQKLVLGTLSSDRFPQQQFDLVFDKAFELSHNWKNGSVYFYGYRANNAYDDSEDETGDDSEDIPLNIVNNEKPSSKPKQEKPTAAGKKVDVKSDSAVGKQKVKIVEPKKDEESDDDESSDEEFEDGPTIDDSDSSESDDSDDDSDDEETPQKKVEASKKRPAESSSKISGSDKKAKFVTPQKTDGKKAGGGHVATPHPSKQAGKTPKSAGSHSCNSCEKSFNSEQALESHSKAKHSAGK